MQSDWLSVLAAAAGSYLLGSVPFGLLLARARGVDIRSVGSGNIGATNVFRAVGKGPGLLTFFLDFLKGLLPVLAAGHWLAPDTAAPILCGCAAIAGHIWTVFAQFRGGKGVATGAGVVVGIAWEAVIIGLICWIIVFALTRYVSLASIITAGSVGISGWILYPGRRLVPATLTLLAALVIVRHRSNIVRLLKGTENRFDFKKKKEGAE
ncbi:MAG TPA: glycerol-3-phosphate 1-O-acyltransferase PlsY [Kiritimatiellia bacterium]|nr:glycerol-3-phosphate 1-O-acyltransferase PlsY [Kiritimatiellia bacterium]HNR93589.1 glycerol-3-phosphate 1-O-acyltransferase PlsY [Kiritimatiellia bacterium]HNS80731.1 glycerol-3-phosphate 1-O-acyltransferase PlsY [Kiritimatiellia bacterium]HPA77776.1 glycerol-3-phosphate 1-O-acyltransferase PlsY [Kiritimatiellia bacterium]HQQ04587.1 glycerol-3-phosphate 1-O-acyltransferase PlsY [Kiritimatiellia bacterium]